MHHVPQTWDPCVGLHRWVTPAAHDVVGVNLMCLTLSRDPTAAALSAFILEETGVAAEQESGEDESEEETAVGRRKPSRGGRGSSRGMARELRGVSAAAAAVTVMVTGGAWPLAPFSARLRPSHRSDLLPETT